MPIFNFGNRQVLFLHIPKAGGSSITKWLSEYSDTSFFRPRAIAPFRIPPQHLRWRDFDYLLNNPTFDYAFAVVRNPYERLESEYFWRHRNAKAQGKPWDDFNSWVERQIQAVRENSFHASNHLCTQVSFLADPVEVFQLEDGMEKIIVRIADILKIPPPNMILHENARSGEGPALTWSGDTINLVRDFYEADFETFGYDPDGRTITVGSTRVHS